VLLVGADRRNGWPKSPVDVSAYVVYSERSYADRRSRPNHWAAGQRQEVVGSDARQVRVARKGTRNVAQIHLVRSCAEQQVIRTVNPGAIVAVATRTFGARVKDYEVGNSAWKGRGVRAVADVVANVHLLVHAVASV